MTNYGLMQIIGGVNDEGKQEAVKVIDGILQTTGISGGEIINVSADLSKATDSTVTSIASSATSQVILAANSLRKTVIIANDSTAILYLKLNPSAASTSSYSHALAPLASGIPATITLRGEDYSGEITGIWSAANGNARVTETF